MGKKKKKLRYKTWCFLKYKNICVKDKQIHTFYKKKSWLNEHAELQKVEICEVCIGIFFFFFLHWVVHSETNKIKTIVLGMP